MKYPLWALLTLILLSASIITGACGDSSPEAEGQVSLPAKPGFKPQAPHGGVLLDAGDDFAHVEIVFDSKTGTLSAYMLDGEAEEVVPLKQSSIIVRLTHPKRFLKLRAVLSPLTGEKAGETSEYSVTNVSLRGHSQIRGALISVDFNGHTFKNLPFQFPIKKE